MTLRTRSWPRAPWALRLAPHSVLVSAAAGLALALAAPVAAPLALVMVLVAAATAGAAARVDRPRLALAALAAAALIAGGGWGTARLEATAPPDLPLPIHVRGTIAVDAPPTPVRTGGVQARTVAVDLRRSDGIAVPVGARLLVRIRGSDPPGPGAILRVSGSLRPAAGPRDPAWWREYLARQRIAGRLDVAEPEIVGRRAGLRGLRDRWRAWTTSVAGAGLEGDRRGVVRGMALGGGSQLSEPTAQAFRDAGIWHLLAVSGQNVSVVALAVLAVLRACGVGRRSAVLAAGASLVAYCLACDGGASVGRAGAVGAVGLLAELRSGARERWHLMLVALVALLANQPRDLADPGLQLSFCAVVGLFVVAPFARRWLEGWVPAPIAQLMAMALAAGLATAPIVVWHFGRLSLVGLGLNVVAVPLAAPIVVLALIGVGAAAIHPALAILPNLLAGAGAQLLLWAAALAVRVPGAAVDLPPAAALPLAALVVLVCLAGLWTARVTEREPGGLRRRPIMVLAIVLAVAGWAGLRGPPGAVPGPIVAPGVTALDVGQGDAILLRAPGQPSVLIDAGPAGDPPAVMAGLRRAGVDDLATVFLSHGSADHAGGLGAVVARFPAAVVVHPAIGDEEEVGAAALAHAREHGTTTRQIAAGWRATIGGWRIAAISPRPARAPVGDPNPRSLVLVARAGGLSVLLTGDAESAALLAAGPGPVDVLKVSHHGSADPDVARLLARVRPGAALISAGAGNRFGHPHPATLAALRESGVTILRTDVAGDVTASAAPPGDGVGGRR